MADEDENKGTPEEGGEPSEETKEPSEEEAKRKKQEEQEEKKRKKQEAKEEKKRKKEERKKRKKGKKGGSEDGEAEEGEADEDEDVDEEERSIREKIKYEKQLVKEGKILPRGHYIPKGRLRGILAVCLAFFFGIFVTFGALFGVVAYFANFKVREVLKFALGSDSEMNPEDYIAQEYLDGTIFELYGAISDEFGSMDPAGLTIGKFAKYSPYIRTLAEELKEQVAVFGVQCDLDELFATPLSQYGEYLQKNVLMNVEVGKAAGLKADSDPLLLAFCYGEKGVDYEVGPENTIIPKEGGIGPLTVGGIIGGEEFTGEAAVAGLLNRARTIRLGPALEIKADADPLLLAFLYGEKGVDYEVGPENTIIPKEGGICPLTVGGIISASAPRERRRVFRRTRPSTPFATATGSRISNSMRRATSSFSATTRRPPSAISSATAPMRRAGSTSSSNPSTSAPCSGSTCPQSSRAVPKTPSSMPSVTAPRTPISRWKTAVSKWRKARRRPRSPNS